ncbi:hypothetical protein AGMMS49579_15520 [Spirochaetia bacterium]|nr:hypothetical protein AGMMS49579_15520 [Spirochaetia bacterium]
MSPNKRNDLLYLMNILEYIGKVWKYTEETKDAEELYELNEQLNLNASLTLLANIGENVSKISDTLKREYPDIEWQQIKDFRNRIVHDYTGIDLVIVFEIITKDLKLLKPKFENIIRKNIENKIFDIEEIKISKESKYYKNIDFEEII